MCEAEVTEFFCRYTGRTTRLVAGPPSPCREVRQRRGGGGGGGGVPGACRRGLQPVRPATLECADPYCPCTRCWSRLQERLARARARRHDVVVGVADSVATDLLAAAAAAVAVAVADPNILAAKPTPTATPTAAAAAAAAGVAGAGDVYIDDVYSGGGGGGRASPYYPPSIRSDVGSIGVVSLATGSFALGSACSTTATVATTSIASMYTTPTSSVTSLLVVRGQGGGDKGRGGAQQRAGRIAGSGDAVPKRAPKILVRRRGCP